MARKRTEFTQSTQARILALMGQGGTADSITAQLHAEGHQVSRATVARRMRELSGLERKSRPRAVRALPPAPAAPADEPPLPDRADEIPPGTSIETLDTWLTRVERIALDAENNDDLDALGKAGRLATILLEAKRKATPIAKPDPNDNPDMIEMGSRVAKELHRLVDLVVLP